MNRVAPFVLMKIWLLIIKRIKGQSFLDELKILLSSIVDVTLSILKPFSVRIPKAYFAVRGITLKGINMKFETRPNSDDIYMLLPYREGDVDMFIRENLQPGDVFVDCGANVGYYTILASRIVGGDGRVVSFEANPLTFEYLKRNVEINNCTNVDMFNLAVYDVEGERLFLDFSEGFFCLSKISDRGKISVKTTTLQKKLTDLGVDKVKILKLDIEGSEYRALIGANGILERVRFVVLECSKDEDKIFNFLERMGFSIRKMKFTTYILAENRKFFSSLK